jgi:hypothetical protein
MRIWYRSVTGVSVRGGAHTQPWVHGRFIGPQFDVPSNPYNDLGVRLVRRQS